MVTYVREMDEPDAMDPVFRALADVTRREILDALFSEDGQTVGHLCARFEERMSRFGVMKHLAVLADADLVVAVREGRTKRLFLNPVPIEQVGRPLDRQVRRAVHRRAGRPSAARRGRPGPPRRAGGPRLMAITTHVYQIYIAATAEQVWQAITDSEWTRSTSTPPRSSSHRRPASPTGP